MIFFLRSFDRFLIRNQSVKKLKKKFNGKTCSFRRASGKFPIKIFPIDFLHFPSSFPVDKRLLLFFTYLLKYLFRKRNIVSSRKKGPIQIMSYYILLIQILFWTFMTCTPNFNITNRISISTRDKTILEFVKSYWWPVHCTIPKNRDLRSDLNLCKKVGSTVRSQSQFKNLVRSQSLPKNGIFDPISILFLTYKIVKKIFSTNYYTVF